MIKNETKFFIPFAKVDREKRMVYGYVSTEAEDTQGEIVEKEALRKAWPEYWKWRNIREMHQASAVGVGKEYMFDDKGVWIGAKIVDDNAWKKVKEEVYKGFSIGGKVLRKVGNRIKELFLSEISLVDRPANPEAVFTLVKRDESGNWIGDNSLKVEQKIKDKSVNMARKKLKKQEEIEQEDVEAKEEEEEKEEEVAETPQEEETEVIEEENVEEAPEEEVTEEETPSEQSAEPVPEEETEEEAVEEEPTAEEGTEEEQPPVQKGVAEVVALSEVAGNLSWLIKAFKQNGRKGAVLKRMETALQYILDCIKDEAKLEEKKKAEDEKSLSKGEGGLSKVEKALSKVERFEKEIASLKERVEKIENRPRADRPKASYLVGKGEEGGEEEIKKPEELREELKKIEDEINEAWEEAKKIMKSGDPSKEAKVETKLNQLREKYIQKKLELRRAVYGY